MTRFLVLAACVLAFAFVLASGLRAPSQHSDEVGNLAGTDWATTPKPSTDPDFARKATGQTVVVPRGPEGHFTTQANVNGAAFPMVIDSGASLVVLRREDAMAAGLSVFPSEFTGSAQTAGGMVRTKRVVLDRISLGGIERRNVAAAVVDADLPVSLLGQSFLAQLDEVRIADDEMILR